MECLASTFTFSRIPEYLAGKDDYFVFSEVQESLDDGSADVA